MAFKTVIVDDERPSREELKVLLSVFDEFVVVGEFDNAFDALAFLVESTPEVVFFDINMPGFNGLQLADAIRNSKNPPLVVFITAYANYAVKAFEVEAVDYLLKPIDAGRFAKTIKKIKDKLKTSEKPKLRFVVCQCNDELLLLKPEHIQYFYTNKGRLYAKKGSEAIQVKGMKLQDVEEKFKEDNFLRINKEYIINLNKVVKLSPLFKGRYIVNMENGDKLSLSPHHQKEFKEHFNF
ncbi:MAG: LytR/AlgR family response regulator transcription factor [Caldisericaceae bacterium]